MTQKFLGHPLLVFYPLQTTRKVLARLKYSAPLYMARSRFSILTEEYLTFQTVSPTDSSATHIKGQWKTLCAGTTQAATHIVEEVFIDRNHAGSSKARSAQGASQFAAGYAAVRL